MKSFIGAVLFICVAFSANAQLLWKVSGNGLNQPCLLYTSSGMLRIMTDAQSTLYPDSKYSDCMPIGSIDVINNFPYQDIRDYYAKWYRPDLQGIVIVGDINVDEIEAKLKKVFARCV